MVSYTYDPWGVPTVSGDASLAAINPCSYRGYYYDQETGYYYLQSRYYNPEIGRFLNADEVACAGVDNSINSSNLFTYCNNNPICYADSDGYIASKVIGAIVGAVIGAVGGYFLGTWFANKLGLSGWKRTLFIAGFSAIVGAAAAVIGYFIGPYIAKAWSYYSAKLMGLVKGAFRGIAKITSQKMAHINVAKHLWNRVLSKVTSSGIENLIYQAIRKGSWNFLSNGTIQILWRYKGYVIEVTGKIIDGIFKIGDAWVRR